MDYLQRGVPAWTQEQDHWYTSFGYQKKPVENAQKYH